VNEGNGYNTRETKKEAGVVFTFCVEVLVLCSPETSSHNVSLVVSMSSFPSLQAQLWAAKHPTTGSQVVTKAWSGCPWRFLPTRPRNKEEEVRAVHCRSDCYQRGGSGEEEVRKGGGIWSWSADGMILRNRNRRGEKGIQGGVEEGSYINQNTSPLSSLSP